MEEPVESGDEDFGSISSHNPDSDASDREFVMSSVTTTSDESESEGDDDENGTSEITDLLNKSNIDEHEFDEPSVSQNPGPSKNTRQLRNMRRDIF